MAINFTDFSKAPIQKSIFNSLLEDTFKGYQMGRAPKQMDQEEKAREMKNQLSKLELEHKPKEFELNDKGKSLANAMNSKALEHYDEQYGQESRLREAQINKANRPDALKGNLAQAMQLRNSLDPDSPTYERDLGQVNSYINKLGTLPGGVQISTNPEGGVEVSVGGKGEVANAMGLAPLPKGQTYLFDENKKPIGIGKPYTEKEKKEESGRSGFNVYQKFISESQSPYTGAGSTKKFQSDIFNYSSDPEAKKRIDNFLASDKLLFSAAVKEDATLGGANTNMAYKGLIKSLKSAEVYPLLKEAAKYELPAGYAKDSNEIFSKILNEGTEAGKNIPAYRAQYFNKPPEQKLQNAPAAAQMENPKIIGTTNGITQIEYAGKKFKIPENLVDKFMTEHSGSGFNE